MQFEKTTSLLNGMEFNCYSEFIANEIKYFQIDILFFEHTYYPSSCIVLHSRTELEKDIT